MLKKWIIAASLLTGSVAGNAFERLSLGSLTEEDKREIEQVIGEIHRRPVEQLLKEDKNFKEKLSKVRKIYPIVLLSYISSEEELYQKFREILQVEKKSSIFLVILSMEIKEATEEGLIEQYITKFADFLSLDRETIQAYILQKKYKDLMRYIFGL